MPIGRLVTMAFICIFLVCPRVPAQFALRSSITGHVTDDAGAVIPDTPVTLVDVDRGQTLSSETNGEGIYTFDNVTFGHYQVVVERTGFRKAVSETFEVASQQSKRVDVTLAPGSVDEVMEVHSGESSIQVDQAVVGQVVNRKYIDTLPIKGRNFTQLITLAPNVTTYTQSNQNPETYSVGSHQVASNTTYTVGGGGDNGYYMNGVNINDNWVGAQSFTPSTEALVEAKVDVANFSAQNGRDISTFSVATRSGSADYHGSVYDYFQNSGLNAWNAYDKQFAAPGEKQNFFVRNQYGGNFGGPVVIPKLYNGRDRAFFFANVEFMRQRESGADDPVRVPTAAERTGDFSQLLNLFPNNPEAILYNPYSTQIVDGESVRDPIRNNDLSRLTRPDGSPLVDQRAVALLGLFPLPNFVSPIPGDLANYRARISNGVNTWRLDSRFDYTINEKDSIYVNYSRSHGLQDRSGGVIPELVGNVEDSSYITTINYAHVFAPGLTNELIVGFGKGSFYSVDQNTLDYLNQTDTLRNQYFSNLGTGLDTGVYLLSIGDPYGNGLPDAGFGEVFYASNPTLQFADNMSWLKGRHSVKAGFNYFRKKEVDWDFIRNVYFSNQFTRAGSANVDASGASINHLGGDPIADFLIGLPTSMQQRFDFGTGDARDPLLNFAIPYWGFYGEDQIKVTPNLTATVGLRYDLAITTFSPTRYGNAYVDFAYPGWQLVIPGLAPNTDLHYVGADKNNFAPRLSLAYSFRNDLVVRASYGIFYDQGVYSVAGENVLDGAFGSTPGYTGDYFSNDRLGINQDLPGYTLDDIFPAQQTVQLGTYPISTGVGTGYFDYQADVRFQDPSSGVTPYFQRYMLDVQKAAGSNLVLSATYLGARGAKLPYYENLNLPSYQLGRTYEEYQAARPNDIGRFGDVRVLRHGLNTFYNAVTLKVEGHFSDRFQLLAHYTFSKTVEDYDALGDYPLGWQYHRSLGRGEADYSHPHRFVSALTYETPVVPSFPAFVRGLLGGWRISTVAQFESGDALTVLNASTDARDGEPNLPNVSGNPNLSGGEQTGSHYFDTSVFTAPAPDTKGNAGVGILRGPGVNNWDVSLAKVFHLTERWNTEFRADFFNAFNHTQWSGVDTNYSTEPGNTFGYVTGAREARIIQFGLKVSF